MSIFGIASDEGRLPVVSAIVWKHPDLFDFDAARAVVAIEHFRLCCVLGTPISREAIAKLYRIPPSELPENDSNQVNPSRAKNINYPVVGKTFCGYPLIAELGRGALARVYLAQQPDLAQRLVVLKVTERATSEADKLARFAAWEDLSEQMVIQQPTDPSQWFTLGAARWTLGEYERARHAFDVAEKLQPGSSIALF